MKTRKSVVETRSNGLKHFDNAVKKTSRQHIVDGTVNLALKHPNTWGGGWSNVLWASGNVVIDILDKEIQQTWNLDEAFTEEEIKYIAQQLGLDLKDYTPLRPRKTSH